MTQYAWVLQIRPGYEDEYRRRHSVVWPEMEAALRAAGVRNYSIFRYGLTLFGYFECDDVPAMVRSLRSSDVSKRWRDYMEPCINYDVDPSTNYPYLLPLIWHMD
ncbi:L-rhamnose mutarotase [Chelativorans sp. AA-79]|uniref:L-rhamnose mutarotase n=1 Tax=Chelativorans sp. AA-79 TaxID=3028735 RepID=UPI0023F9B2FB|nr:L-rhamnose mutarotase [Chelativorans sp. AA-79]WEX12252.1 L-rhamnose mutarotase [Chelativorans sp. AA-79]